MINIQSHSERRRKSDKLTDEELRSLKKFVGTFSTIIDAAVEIGIHRNVLDLVLVKGSGSPETVQKIREKLNSVNKAA
jgi:hypothetical protein